MKYFFGDKKVDSSRIRRVTLDKTGLTIVQGGQMYRFAHVLCVIESDDGKIEYGKIGYDIYEDKIVFLSIEPTNKQPEGLLVLPEESCYKRILLFFADDDAVGIVYIDKAFVDMATQVSFDKVNIFECKHTFVLASIDKYDEIVYESALIAELMKVGLSKNFLFVRNIWRQDDEKDFPINALLGKRGE